MRTTAARSGDRWVLNGEKRWITSGGIADVAVVWARSDDGGRAVRGFLVERGTPGFSTRDIEGKFSLRASVTCELIFEDCAVPRDAMLPGVERPQGPAVVPQPGALRHRLGRHRRGDGLLRRGAALHQGARAVQAADRRLPAGAGEAGRHARGDHQGAAAGLAPRAAQGGGQGAPAAGLAGQAQQRAHGAATSRATRATSSAPTASPTSTRRAATCATSSRSSPTRAPTTSTR